VTTAEDVVEQLQRRMAALEANQFALTEQLRQVHATAECAATGLDNLEDALHELSTTAADTTDTLTATLTQRQAQLTPDTDTDAAGLPDHGPALPDLHAWVQTRIAVLVRKTTTTGEGGGIRWCRLWWQHSDAVQRFTALYLAYAQLSAEQSQLWLSIFLRDHLDPHLATLTSPYGPFHACTPRKHSTAIEALGHAELAQHLHSGGQDDHTTAQPQPEREPGA
jgi:hypothetical protein